MYAALWKPLLGMMYVIAGNLRVASRLNFEAGPTSYTLLLRAIDTPRPLFYPSVTELNLTVTIVNVNEMPLLASESSFAFNENTLPHNYSTVGTIVHTVVAGDIDMGQTHYYTIASGNTGNAFVVSATVASR
jgi:hypothetical protein